MNQNFAAWYRYLHYEKKVFQLNDYVEFDERNFSVFSREIMSLYLNICSEVEAVYKLFTDNAEKFHKFRAKAECLNNKDLLRNEISIGYNEIKFTPFESIFLKQGSGGYVRLEWWSKHNDVKHDRENNFEQATLGSLLEALCALFITNIYYYFEFTQNTCISPASELFTSGFYIAAPVGGGGFSLWDNRPTTQAVN